MKKQFFFVECGYSIERKGDTTPLFNQVHGRKILEIKSFPQLPDNQLVLEDADGAFSCQPESELHVYTADCLPLLFFTERKEGPICAVHAGWRGIRLGIASEALSHFSSPNEVHVVVGPSIGSCCFAVREDFIQEWKAVGLDPLPYLEHRDEKVFFNLLSYLRGNDLVRVSDQNIHLDFHRCTVCSSPSLPSFRRNKSANPRLRSWVRKLA